MDDDALRMRGIKTRAKTNGLRCLGFAERELDPDVYVDGYAYGDGKELEPVEGLVRQARTTDSQSFEALAVRRPGAFCAAPCSS